MNPEFNLGHVIHTEFGVGREDVNGQSFVVVPVGTDVQSVLRDMVRTTLNAMGKDENGPAKYEPSEKHGSIEYLYLAIEDELARSVRLLHEAANLDINPGVLSDPSEVFCYFTRLIDNEERHLTALRRATQFKGILKCRNRLIRMLDNTLRIVEDSVFRLDNDFDFLVDDTNVHILRPSSFEFVGGLQQAILDAVPNNIKAIEKDLAFVKFNGMIQYAAKHPRAARYLASIRGQAEARNIDKGALKKICRNTGVEIVDLNGKIEVAVGHELGFLEVLDRRRYELELVKDHPERFKAGSRTKLDGN